MIALDEEHAKENHEEAETIGMQNSMKRDQQARIPGISKFQEEIDLEEMKA